MSSSNCCFLICIQFLKRQVRWSGSPISFRIFHSLSWSTQSMGSQIVRQDWATFTFTFPFIVSWSLNPWATREVSTALSLRWLILSLLYLVCCWTLLLFFRSVIVCFSSVASIWQFLIFPISLLKFSLCSSILLPSSASFFMTITLNSLSTKLFISISLRLLPKALLHLVTWNRFLCFFILLDLCVSFYTVDETPSLPVLKELPCVRNEFFIQPALSHLSNSWDCWSSLLYFLRVPSSWACAKTCPIATEQDTMVLAPPPTTSFACLLPMENFSPRISFIKEVRNAETKENSQRRPNNNNVVIKHSQGPLVPSQGL